MANLLGLPVRVAEEVLSAVPALVDRTRSQVELTQHLLAKLPCSPLHREASDTDSAGADDASNDDATRATVTDIRSHQHAGSTATGDDGDRAVGSDSEATDSDATDSDATDEVESPDIAAVDASELAIPDYDSLAASQVVPRLASLEPAELALVLDYEQGHRSRQTIINRVRQLQATADGS